MKKSAQLPLFLLVLLFVLPSFGGVNRPLLPQKYCQAVFSPNWFSTQPRNTSIGMDPKSSLGNSMAPGSRFGRISSDALETLKSKNEYKHLAKGSKGIVGETLTIKFLIDRRGSKPKVYFFNTPKFEYHINFAQQYLNFTGSVESFNATYEDSSNNRQFVAGSINLSKEDFEKGVANPRLLLEFWSGDKIGRDVLAETYKLIGDSVGFESQLVFHPLSDLQLSRVELGIENTVPVVTSEELLAGREFFSLNEGESKGYLRFTTKKELESGEALFDYSSLLVIDDVPNELGLVGGVITEKPQTPLSHVNVKSINRKTPNAFLKDALAKLLKYKDQPVHLKVTASGVEVQVLDSSTADQEIFEFWSSRRPKLKSKPSPIYDSQWNGKLLDLENFYQRLPTYQQHRSLIRRVGAKAANLALISFVLKRSRSNIKVKSPAPLVHSFDANKLFLDQNNGQPRNEISQILNEYDLLNPAKFHDIKKVHHAMGLIQSKIKSFDVPELLVDSILNDIYENENSPIFYKKGVPRIRLRSSTNAEDLDGFTGAGLYDSFGISLFEKDDLGFYDFNRPKSRKKVRKKIIEALKGIFAAVWNVRAFMEREWFSINGRQHLDIAMGVAIHRAFPGKDFSGEFGEMANGVAVTDDPYDDDNPYVVYLNSQHLDLAVTNPPTIEELLEYEIDPNAPYSTEVTLVNTTPDVTGQIDFWNQWRNWTYEVRSRSSVFDGSVVLVDNSREKQRLSEMEVRRLSQAIQEIRYAFSQVYGKPFERFKVDVEWKVYGDDRELWIKQARPFN